jgi:hypothetical protein
MSRIVISTAQAGLAAGFLALASLAGHAAASEPIQGQDVDGHAVAVNGKGHYTVVMYTNPDLEDESRAMTLAMDPYRSRSDFALIRVVDLRGDVPPQMRGVVRGQIRKEMARENKRLKDQRGIANASARADHPRFQRLHPLGTGLGQHLLAGASRGLRRARQRDQAAGRRERSEAGGQDARRDPLVVRRASLAPDAPVR